jgi:hypothetical protein
MECRYGGAGVNFGLQSLLDRGLNITTSFIKRQGGLNGGDWTNRISVHALQNKVPSKFLF